MKALRQAYPNYFADTGSFLEILGDLEGREKPKENLGFKGLDLSFLESMASSEQVEKQLRLLDTGYVYWGEELVGKWEEGNFGHHFFKSGMGEQVAVQAEGIDNFRSALREWLGAR